MNNTEKSITVHDANMTVSGLLICALKCSNIQLNKEDILFDEEGRKWKVIDNDVKVRFVDSKRILKEYEEASIGFVKLEVINFNGLPKVGQLLQLLDKSGL